MNYRTIDMAAYPRKAHFDYFRSLQNPMLGVTVEVDVTALRAMCKAEGCSFYLAFMRCAARAAELAAAAAFTDENGNPARVDILRALNRMSSMIYILMIQTKAGKL